jgi:hypothetical protein
MDAAGVRRDLCGVHHPNGPLQFQNSISLIECTVCSHDLFLAFAFLHKVFADVPRRLLPCQLHAEVDTLRDIICH